MTTNSRRSVFQVASRPAVLALSCGVALALTGLSACHKGSSAKSQSNLAVGSSAIVPGQTGGSALAFVVDENGGGRRTKLGLKGLYWGRLADIRDESNILRHRDFLIGEGFTTNSQYVVEVNPITERTTVTIRSTFSTDPDSEYATRLRALEANLTEIDDKSLALSELPPFPLVPRNATIALVFDDLVESASIAAESVRLATGYPPIAPYQARVFADPNHGDLADYDDQDGLEFYSTRILIDPTVSSIEAGETNPPLAVNVLGLPASLTTGQANVAIRLPSRVDPDSGSLVILRNKLGRALDVSSSGSVDAASPTIDVVRGVRSGGTVTFDVNNGFLADDTSPSVLGTQAAVAQNIAPGPTVDTYVADLNFAVGTCANRLVAGDILQQGGLFAEVICPPFQVCPPDAPVTGDVNGSSVPAVFFRVVATEPGGKTTLENGAVSVAMRYNSSVPAGKERCFVSFSQITLPPDRNVAPTSTVTVRFTKPIDPTTIKPFDTMLLLRKNPTTTPTPGPYDLVVGAVSASLDLREFRFIPALPLTHDPVSPVNATTGQTAIGEEPYWLRLLSGLGGPLDLSGRALATTLPPVRFSMDASASKQDTSGFALRFNIDDELSGVGGDATTGGVGRPEFRGQFVLDSARELMRPRPVTHFSAAADRTVPVPALMGAVAGGQQTPLSRFGSKMQTLWRYCDVGFLLLDESNHNVDVEGISWSPSNGAVIADNFLRFEMSLSHCFRLPDESLALGQPAFPNSGIRANYGQNQLDATNDTLRRVYPVTGGPTGYTVSQAQLYQGPTGTNFVPFPMNRGVARSLYSYYTWRDTALLAVGGPPDSPGAELPIHNSVVATGLDNGVPFAPSNVPTIGLPLLMEYRCYPDDSALGLNAFDVSQAIVGFNVPNFRAFSTGGVNTQNQIVRKDPDLQSVADGGFNPASTPTPGATTLPTDNVFYIGNLDLVTRISRVHSIWFDATTGTVQYAAPVMEPREADQPAGTQIVLAYRGATQISNTALTTNAEAINWYGNRLAAGTDPVFLGGDATWKASLAQLNGARFFQVRITFFSNPETGLNPELSGLGFTYRK